MMRLVIGLGNPGGEYEGTRHNVGLMVVERMREAGPSKAEAGPSKAEAGVEGKWKVSKRCVVEMVKVGEVILVKTGVFMNDSGRAVRCLVDYYKVGLDGLWIIHDDLDLRLGEFKIQFGRGPKAHKGVLAVERALGRKGFWRVRIGIDNRGEKPDKGEDYVLGKFRKEEKEKVALVIKKIVKEMKEVFKQSL